MPAAASSSESHANLLQIGTKVAARARRNIRAYREFLRARDVADDAPFESLPPTDKETYLKQFPFSELVGDDFNETFTIFSSSGSSGHAFYWPQLKSGHVTAAEDLRNLLEGAFEIHRRRTLAIIGLALGSWIGGDHFSWAFKNVSLAAPYPFAVFSPGNKHDEIISIIHSAAQMADQFLLVCCPSAIGHLLLRAEQTGRPLPLEKLRYLVIGEPFPEFVRLDLERRSGASDGSPLMLSVYGSADTGVLGFESPLSVVVRRLCAQTPEFSAALGLPASAPHFFHVTNPEVFLETVQDELLVTRWQGIPLVRYNLHDSARLLHWSEVVAAAKILRDGKIRALLESAPTSLSDRLLAIAGRADSCLILCGTNLAETMLDDALRSPELHDELTGAYQASIVIEDGRQRLEIVAESRKDPAANPDMENAIYPRLIAALGRAQPEFLDDWNSIYRQWDEDPARRIVKLSLVAWPVLSEMKMGVKHRGIVR